MQFDGEKTIAVFDMLNDKFKNTLTQKGLSEIEVNKGDVFDAEIVNHQDKLDRFCDILCCASTVRAQFDFDNIPLGSNIV